MLGPDGAQRQRLYGGPVTSAVAAVDVERSGRTALFIALEDGYLRRIEVGKGFAWKTLLFRVRPGPTRG